jgi:hypothetical protein
MWPALDSCVRLSGVCLTRLRPFRWVCLPQRAGVPNIGIPVNFKNRGGWGLRGRQGTEAGRDALADEG